MNSSSKDTPEMIPIESVRSVLNQVLPSYSPNQGQIIIGKPNIECASCRKPFNQSRKRRKCIRLYPTFAIIPIVLSYSVCGRCYSLHQKGGVARNRFLTSIQAYAEGREA